MRIKANLIMLLRCLAASAGFELHRIAPLDLREKTTDPIEAMYLAKKREFLINVNIEDCRSWLGFKLADHPYSRTASEYIQNQNLSYADSPLWRYYHAFCPKSAAELLGLAKGESSILDALPPLARVYPWNPANPEKIALTKRKISDRENLARGKSLDISHGYTVYGPVSEEKGNIEFSTLIGLVASVSAKGYQRTDKADGDIQVTLAVNENGEARYFITKGHHRAAVLHALGHKEIPVRVSRNLVIRKQEVSKWPHVSNHTFTSQQAIKIFDSHFNGNLLGKSIWS